MRSALKISFLEEVFPVRTGAIFLIGFLARVIYLYLNDAVGGFDTLDYLKLADNLYHHHAYSLHNWPDLTPSLRRPPGYPFFLAFFQWLGGGNISFPAVALVQCVLDAVTASVIFLLARKIVSAPFAFAAALFYALHPGAILRSNLLLTESLFTFLIIAGVLFLIDAFEKEKIWRLMPGGVLLGLAVLTRPIAVIVPVLLILAVFLKVRSEKKSKFITIFGAVFLLALAPWLVRCYTVSGRFVFVQGVTAFQFYAPTRVDLEQWDEEKLWRDFFDPHTGDEYFRALARAETPADFLEAERTGWQNALANIKAQPRAYLTSRLKSYPYFFLTSFDNFTGINNSYRTLLAQGDLSGLAIKLSLLLVFSLLPFVLSLVGLLRAGRELTSLLSASIWISVLLIHLPMWLEFRFWMPFVPFQILTAVAGLKILRDLFWPPKE